MIPLCTPLLQSYTSLLLLYECILQKNPVSFHGTVTKKTGVRTILNPILNYELTVSSKNYFVDKSCYSKIKIGDKAAFSALPKSHVVLEYNE
jgi:hypothetical protein